MGKVPEELFKEPDAYAVQRAQMEQMAKQNLEFEQLCCEKLSDAGGKRLYEILEERFVTRQLIDPNSANCQNAAIWWDGFRQCIFMLYGSAKAHLNRIYAAQTKQAIHEATGEQNV